MTFKMKSVAAALMCFWVLSFAGCKTTQSQLAEDTPLLTDGKPKLCAAMRGNGHYIMTHFASLARIVEHFGPVDGIAGGSSGSASAFIYESMLKNPMLRQCGSRPCTREEAALRLGLMLKSVIGYFDVAENSTEAMSVYGLKPLMVRARAQGLYGAVAETGELRDKLLKLLSSKDIEDVVNPEILAMLRVTDPILAVRNAQEVFQAISTFGNYSTEDQRIFLRPGIFDFKVVAKRFGRVGSFYAGYEPIDRDAFNEWLTRCAVESSRGVFWDHIVKNPAGSSTCGEEFSRIVLDYREKLLANESAFPSRINEPVGGVIPMILATSIIYGESNVKEVKKQLDNYLNAKRAEIHPGLSGLKFGYWGNSESIAALEANPHGFSDLRTKRRLSLGTATWSQVLSISPAEPGLAKIQVLNEKMASAGGWSDLSPTLALKSIGCEKTIYITRRGEESTFPDGVAKLLGVDDEERGRLYNLDDPKSSFSRALQNADAIWCTDWNKFTDFEFMPMARESYGALMVTNDQDFSRNVLAAYPNIATNSDFRGCKVGGTP